jgi:hypothetical protein
MPCDVCKHDAPYTQAQLDRRKHELERSPNVGVYPCPECGGTDYMLSTANLNQAPPRPYDGILTTAQERAAIAKQRPRQPPRSLWARLIDWWSFRK